MDNVIPFPNSRLMIPGWDLSCVILRPNDQASLDQLQTMLDEGYEPFSVNAFPQASSPSLVTGKTEMVLVEKIWFKRPVAPVPAELPEPPRLA